MTSRVYRTRCYVSMWVTLETFGQAALAREQREIAVGPVVPRRAEWTCEEWGTPDSADVEIEWRELGLDPRTIRDARVAIVLANVGPDERLGGLDRQERRFIGYVDTPLATFDERREVLRVSARDYAGRLEDTPHTYQRAVATSGENANRAPVRIDKPLRDVIADLLSPLEFYKRIAPDAEIERNDKPSDKTSRSTWTPHPGDSLWRVIQDVCRLTGQVARFGPDGVLRVTAPASAEKQYAVSLAYGDQVSALELERNLNPWRRQRIRLQQLNEDTGEILTATYPADDSLEGILAFPLTGARTQADLNDLAKRTFQTYERREMRGRVETRAALDADGNEVYAVRTGDRIAVPTRVRDETRAMGLSVDELARDLSRRGMTEDNAKAIADGWQRADELTRLFYVRRAMHRWDRDTGYTGTFDLGNFVQRAS